MTPSVHMTHKHDHKVCITKVVPQQTSRDLDPFPLTPRGDWSLVPGKKHSLKMKCDVTRFLL